MNITDYGFRGDIECDRYAGIPARILTANRGQYEIICDNGFGRAHLKKSCYRTGEELIPVTGDYVMVDWQEAGESRIVATLPRKTFFSRRDPAPGQRAQGVAANFDYVFILQSLDGDFNLARLERYLTLGWQSGAVPVVVLSKADCVADYSMQLNAATGLAAGAQVLAVSTKTGLGIAELTALVKTGETVVLLGSSGVGKSSLVNALAGVELMATGEIRQSDKKGRHTTTRRQLILLKSGVIIIDTPGMRELGMWDVSEGLSKNFADVEAYLGRCRFSDCRHGSEPGCAVNEALRSGELSRERWESYLRLGSEAQVVGDKASFLREQKHRGKVRDTQRKIARQQKGRGPDYRSAPCNDSFTCKVCGAAVSPEAAGSSHRNHCPHCLSSVHLDNTPGDRAALCGGIMDPIGVWVRKDNEWAIIHRCRSCGELHSNRIAADDNPTLLMSIAVRPLAQPPFPLGQLTAGN